MRQRGGGHSGWELELCAGATNATNGATESQELDGLGHCSHA